MILAAQANNPVEVVCPVCKTTSYDRKTTSRPNVNKHVRTQHYRAKETLSKKWTVRMYNWYYNLKSSLIK